MEGWVKGGLQTRTLQVLNTMQTLGALSAINKPKLQSFEALINQVCADNRLFWFILFPEKIATLFRACALVNTNDFKTYSLYHLLLAPV